MSSNAFSPQGLSYQIDADDTATDGVQVPSDPGGQSGIMIQNLGPDNGWLAWGAVDVECVIPQDGTPANGKAFQAGAILVLTIPPNVYFSAKCGTGDECTFELVRGEGN